MNPPWPTLAEMSPGRLRRHVCDSMAILAVLVFVALGVVQTSVLVLTFVVFSVALVIMRFVSQDPGRRPTAGDAAWIGTALVASIAVVGATKDTGSVAITGALTVACAVSCHAVRLWRYEGQALRP